MKSKTLLRTGAEVSFALFAIAAQPSAWGQTFTTFDPPSSQGTSPVSINPAGQITGSYFDANFATHVFLRAKDGTFNTVEIPRAHPPTQLSPTPQVGSRQLFLTPTAIPKSSFALPAANSPSLSSRPHI